MIAQKRINKIFKLIFQFRFSSRIRRFNQRSMQSIRKFNFIIFFFSSNIILNDVENFEMFETSQISQNEINQLKAQITTKHVFQQAKRANVVRAAKLRAKLKRLKIKRDIIIVNQLINEKEFIDDRRFFL